MRQTIRITLEAARVNAGFTQKQVSSEIGVSVATIVLWEKGERIPSVEKALKLAELYKVPLECINFAKKVESK